MFKPSQLTNKRGISIKSRKSAEALSVGLERASGTIEQTALVGGEALPPEDYKDLALASSQVGLPFSSEYGGFLVVKLNKPESFSFQQLKDLAKELYDQEVGTDYKGAENPVDGETIKGCITVVAVSYGQWRHWAEATTVETAAPGIHKDLFAGEDKIKELLTDEKRSSPPYCYDSADLYFHVKAFDRDHCEKRIEWIKKRLENVSADQRVCIGDSRHGGAVYQGRILHGLIGTVDPVGLSARAIIGDEMPEHKGGCVLVSQRFEHDWDHLGSLNDLETENLIGRDRRGNIVTDDDERSHVKLVRVNDDKGVNYRILGQAFPYGESPSGPGREIGIFQASYAKTMRAHIAVMDNMIGDVEGFIKCRHLNVSHAVDGGYWYVPSAHELGLMGNHEDLSIPVNDFFLKRSVDNRMFYNSKDYMCHVGNHEHEYLVDMQPLPTDRVVELLGFTFSRWHDTWYRKRPMPEKLGHLKDYPDGEEFMKESVQVRKGHTINLTLDMLSSKDPGQLYDLYRIHRKELIAGVLPDFTLSSLAEVMGHLNDEERISGFLCGLDSGGMAGHNVPRYQHLVDKGIGAMLEDIDRRKKKNNEKEKIDEQAWDFYKSAEHALRGVQKYMLNWADLAKEEWSKWDALPKDKQDDAPADLAEDIKNLQAVEERFRRLSVEAPKSFHDALQLVFSMHCCLHIIGEFTSLGRLDQVLGHFLDNDIAAHVLTEGDAQELIDCFWIKMDEKVLLNRRSAPDRKTHGGGAVVWVSGDFPQGAALNQWVMQVTVGGSLPNDKPKPENACNLVTKLCLRSARRLPFNAPCLSLKVGPHTPTYILEEAAKTILAGGAHPLLINDEKITLGMLEAGKGLGLAHGLISLSDARDVSCDGCFESLVMGKTEFAYFFCPAPGAIEYAMNRGRAYAMAGPTHLMGLKLGERSAATEDIKSWEEFYQIFLDHYRMDMTEQWSGMLGRYGNIHKYAPSPLLSTMVEGCVEIGRDLGAGGAKYRIVSPLINGMATTIDSLYAIQKMVYDPAEAVTTLPELLECLICDWGHDMKEPFQSAYTSEGRSELKSERFQGLRRKALSLPKFAMDSSEIDAFGRRVYRDLIAIANDVLRSPPTVVKEQIDRIKDVYGEHAVIIGAPSVATFEDYFAVGGSRGASADGRRSMQPVPSDASPSLYPMDLPVPERRGPEILRALEGFVTPEGEAAEQTSAVNKDPFGVGLPCGAPVDVRIREGFSLDKIQKVVNRFAAGEIGTNMLTITVADQQTMRDALQFPEQYDLLRMRMGGWSEFFVAMFPQQQQHHMHRPYYEETAIITKAPSST